MNVPALAMDSCTRENAGNTSTTTPAVSVWICGWLTAGSVPPTASSPLHPPAGPATQSKQRRRSAAAPSSFLSRHSTTRGAVWTREWNDVTRGTVIQAEWQQQQQQQQTACVMADSVCWMIPRPLLTLLALLRLPLLLLLLLGRGARHTALKMLRRQLRQLRSVHPGRLQQLFTRELTMFHYRVIASCLFCINVYLFDKYGIHT